MNTSLNASHACGDLYGHRGWARILLPVVYSGIFVVGFCGNVLALHVIRPNLKNMNSTTLYSANLVASDLLFSLALPFRIAYYGQGFHWALGEGVCKATALLLYINTYAGLSFMTCLSVDRFIAVVLPLRFSRLRQVRRARLVSVCVWMLVLLQTLPLLSIPLTGPESHASVTCMEYPALERVEELPALLIGAVLLGYGVPLLLILLCYSALCLKLRAAAQDNKLVERTGRRAGGVICAVVLVLVVCYSPYHLVLLQYMVRKMLYTPNCSQLRRFQVSLHLSVCLMNLNSCLDPFVYFFACKGYKKKVLTLIRRQASVSSTSAARASPEGSSRDVFACEKVQRSHGKERSSVVFSD